MKLFENTQDQKDQYASTAKVVDDTLVLSLPDAKAPVVWRMDLSEMKSAAFEVAQEDDSYIFLMKTPKGASQKIAPFESREKAMRALMATSEALAHAEKKSLAMTPANDRVTTPDLQAKNAKTNPLVTGLIAVALLIGLLFFMTKIGPQSPSSLQNGTAASAAQETGSSGTAPGTPESAESFLRNR